MVLPMVRLAVVMVVFVDKVPFIGTRIPWKKLPESSRTFALEVVALPNPPLTPGVIYPAERSANWTATGVPRGRVGDVIVKVSVKKTTGLPLA